MLHRAPAKLRTSGTSVIFGKAPRLKVALLVLSLGPLLLLVAIAGVIRLFQSLDDGSISPLRLIILFAHLLGSVMVVTALYDRGRKPRATAPARRRAL